MPSPSVERPKRDVSNEGVLTDAVVVLVKEISVVAPAICQLELVWPEFRPTKRSPALLCEPTDPLAYRPRVRWCYLSDSLCIMEARACVVQVHVSPYGVSRADKVFLPAAPYHRRMLSRRIR